MEPTLCYCTASINNRQRVLASDKYKNIVIRYLQSLHDKKCVRIYGYVIMPNHIHLLWEVLRTDGRETPMDGLLRGTAENIRQLLRREQPMMLERVLNTKGYPEGAIWETPVKVTAIGTVRELIYLLHVMHTNPTRSNWQLCREPGDYPYSSEAFYARGKDLFYMVTHYKDWVTEE
jgi:putative transposase